MKEKIIPTFEEAIADIKDGATLMMFTWGLGGTPQNLIRALYEKKVGDLTIICANFLPIPVGDQIFPINELYSPLVLVNQVKKVVTAWPGSSIFGIKSPLSDRIKRGEVELDVMSHGTLIERIRAGGNGVGGFYTRVGVGTLVEKGKEKRVIDGEEYILEKPLKADFAFVRAYKADRLGNLVYRGSIRAHNPIMATAARVTIAEVDHIVDPGDLDGESIITPHIFVKRVVKIPPKGLGSFEHRDMLKRKVFREGYVTDLEKVTDI
jgi:3-oxoacid CoA-transferase subunit A